ncbi:MAG: hypothetical protein GEV07_18295 [Streptosporangiales bacterium]|nr:hypothetical protein [Streptosporangiales bacterium]
MTPPVRPSRWWYALPGGLLLGGLGLGCLLFWFAVRPLVVEGAGSPMRILNAFVVFIGTVVVGFLGAFVSAMLIAVRRSRQKRALRDDDAG